MPALTLEQQRSLNIQAQMLKSLVKLPTGDVIGVACSLLLQCSYDHPEMLRRVLNEHVVREGLVGVSLISVLNRIAK